jgi:hypothetical protein
MKFLQTLDTQKGWGYGPLTKKELKSQKHGKNDVTFMKNIQKRQDVKILLE